MRPKLLHRRRRIAHHHLDDEHLWSAAPWRRCAFAPSTMRRFHQLFTALSTQNAPHTVRAIGLDARATSASGSGLVTVTTRLVERATRAWRLASVASQRPPARTSLFHSSKAHCSIRPLSNSGPFARQTTAGGALLHIAANRDHAFLPKPSSKCDSFAFATQLFD